MIIREAEERDVPYLMEIYNYEIKNTTATFDMQPKTLEDRMEWFRETYSRILHLILYSTKGMTNLSVAIPFSPTFT